MTLIPPLSLSDRTICRRMSIQNGLILKSRRNSVVEDFRNKTYTRIDLRYRASSLYQLMLRQCLIWVCSFPFPAFAGEAYGVREVSGTTVRLSLIWFTTACKWLTSSLVIEGWAPTFFTVKGKVEDRREVGLPKPRTSKAYPSKP